MEAVFAKIAEETTNFGLGDEEVCTYRGRYFREKHLWHTPEMFHESITC
jgi:hypothetical protein